MDESLADKLRALGVQIGAQAVPPPVRRGFPIEEVLQGRMHPTPFGPAFEVLTSFDLDYRHGEMTFDPHIRYTAMAQWARISSGAEPPTLEQLIFLDTETTGLAGGTGTYVFLVGLGFFDHQGFHVLQIFLKEPEQEEAFLAALLAALDGFQVIVTFNGKSFDVPLLNARHVLNQMSSPFTGMPHIDLLPLARRLWRNRLTSRALKDLETEILRFSRTLDEVPGYLIPELYFDYLRTQDARPLAGVFYHNTMDIVSLFALFQFCSHLLEAPLENSEIPGLDLVAVARLYEEQDKISLAIELYEYSLNKGDLPLNFYLETVLRYATLYRKMGNWEQAVRLWQIAAGHGDLTAYVELAKYYEHQARTPQVASDLIVQALELIPGREWPLWQKQSLERELLHRLARLEKKIGGTNPQEP